MLRRTSLILISLLTLACDVADMEAEIECVEEMIVPACEFTIPKPPDSIMVDLDKIRVTVWIKDYAINFHRVADQASCEGYGFYVENGKVFLCPDACDLVSETPDIEVDVTIGCDDSSP